MAQLKRLVILAHRYLGIAISLLVVMWFATGVTMMYAGGMPRLSAEMRLERMPDVDLSRVRLTPAEAAERAGLDPLDESPGRVRLSTLMERPAYRVGTTTVFADTGDVLEDVSPAQGRAIVAKFMRVSDSQVQHVRTLDRIDQWTLTQSRSMPLHKFQVDDTDGTEAYVQASSGEITMLTTRKGRALAWVSTIPHWMYFVALRENQPLWYRIMVWTSAAVCLLAVLGLVLSVTQFKRVRPFKLANAIPYSGWMRWHYVTGAVFGVFTLTWAFSGLLSMEPFEWTNARGLEVSRDVFTGGPANLSKFAAMEPATWRRVLDGRGIKEVDFVRILDDHYYVVRQTPAAHVADPRPERLHQPYYITGRAEPERVLVNAATLETRQEGFRPEAFIARLKQELPDESMVAADLLFEYDSYYYSRGRQKPLPVLRVQFADAAQTWFYVDTEMGQVLASIPRLARVERWLYNGLHSLDFAFWYDTRPLWDIGMLVLLAGGMLSSSFGLVMGLKRLRRNAARAAKSIVETPVGQEQPVARS
jgi:PepSY-associated transmembrane protein